MNKYLFLVICGAVSGVILVFSTLSYMRAESNKGKDCNPNYSGCVVEYSCSGVDESVEVIGDDVYGLDGDGDGTGCDRNGGTWESNVTLQSIFFGGVGGVILSWLAVRNGYIKSEKQKKELALIARQEERRERAEREGMICPKCNGVLVNKRGKYGKFIGCSTYPSCSYTKRP